MLFGNIFILYYLHDPTTVTITGNKDPLFLFTCFCIQYLIDIS